MEEESYENKTEISGVRSEITEVNLRTRKYFNAAYSLTIMSHVFDRQLRSTWLTGANYR